jgi:hypothetical protein
MSELENRKHSTHSRFKSVARPTVVGRVPSIGLLASERIVTDDMPKMVVGSGPLSEFSLKSLRKKSGEQRGSEDWRRVESREQCD